MVLIAVVTGKPYGLFLAGATGTDASLLNPFDLAKYPFAVIAAAVFGLTPGLLISRLKEVGEKLNTDLQSTDTATGESD